MMATANRLASSSQLGTVTGQSGAQLTSENVSNIPRRSNILFLSDYLQEQRAHRKHYAEDGRRDMASWAKLGFPLSGSPSSKPSSKLFPPIDDFLLGTPVLKARTAAAEKLPLVENPAKSAVCLHPEVEYSASSGEDPAGPLNDSAKQRQLKILNNPPLPGIEAKVNLSRKDKPSKRRKRKMEEKSYSDDAYVKRLEERREKKRVKRNIMEPLVQSDSENNTHQALKKGGKKNKLKATSQTDFALMHGFTATNVGKSRITLQPLRNIGVFKKGKASRALKVGNNIKKRLENDICFSEGRFLNVKSRMRKSETSESSLSGSGKEEPKYNLKPTDMVEVAHGGNHLPYDPANSITWDIEKESCAEKSETNEHQGTIVVKLPRNLSLGSKDDTAPNTLALAGCADTALSDLAGNSAAGLVEISEVSLHPSQSASQVAEKQGTAPDATKCQPTASKYFETRYEPPQDDGQALKDAGAIRSTTPGLSQNRKPGIYRATLSPNSSPRIETGGPSLLPFTDPSPMVDSLPDVFDDISVADRMMSGHNTEEVIPHFSHDTAVSTHLNSDLQIRTDKENREYDLELDFMQYDYQDTHHDNSGASWYFAPSPDRLDDRAGFSDRAQINEWCPNPCELDGNATTDETVLWARQVNGDVDTPIEEYYDRFSDWVSSLDDNARLNGLDLPDSYLTAEIPDTYDGHDTNSHSSLGSVCHVDNFSQGRFLLYCDNPAAQQVMSAEAEVARLLKQSHWVPHRF